MKRIFIINPVSGGRLKEKQLKSWQRLFEERLGSFDHIITESRADTEDKTRKALYAGADQIISVGGDGTLNAVVNGFFKDERVIRPNAVLAVANMGTGSDYFKTIMNGKDTPEWTDLISDFQPRHVDIGRISFFNSGYETKYFVNMASVGITPQIIEMKNRQPQWMPAGLKYFFPTICSIISYRPRRVLITLDSQQFDSIIMGVFISKGICAGGGMKFGGAVSVDDGYFDVKIFEKMPLPKMVFQAGKLYTGSFSGEQKIRQVKARRIAIHSSSPLPVEFDGEVYGTTNIDISAVERGIQICFPPG